MVFIKSAGVIWPTTLAALPGSGRLTKLPLILPITCQTKQSQVTISWKVMLQFCAQLSSAQLSSGRARCCIAPSGLIGAPRRNTANIVSQAKSSCVALVSRRLLMAASVPCQSMG